MKWVRFGIGSVLLIAIAVYTSVQFGSREVQQLQEQVDELEQERARLVEYADRLSAERRVAQVDVIRQRQNRDGHTVSTLLWQEIGADGTLGRPVAAETVGRMVYFEALVIKFARNLVEEGDAARGVSLAMFRRIFGDQQAPESVPEIDRSARPPVTLPDETAESQAELWARFWDMIDDAEVAKRYGVRVVQCEAPAVPLRAGQVWEITLDAAGGLNLRKLATRGRMAGDPGS